MSSLRLHGSRLSAVHRKDWLAVLVGAGGFVFGMRPPARMGEDVGALPARGRSSVHRYKRASNQIGNRQSQIGNPMKATAIANGIYQDPRGRFWIRPVIAGKRTWKKLYALVFKHAREEAADLLAAHRRSLSGGCRSPFIRATNFAELARLYLAAGCPDSRGDARNEEFVTLEKVRIDNLTRYYGAVPLEDIDLTTLAAYRIWRIKRVTRGSGLRTVELDWVSLSNVMSYGTRIRPRLVEVNQVASRWRLREDNPRVSSTAEKIRHCREFAPADGNELHLLAQFFFDEPRSQAVGWQMLFEAFTGVRTSEAIRLRADAATRDVPGFIEGNLLFIARSKRGINPWILITPELRDLLDAFWNWHRLTHAGNPWWFPGQTTSGEVAELRPLSKFSLNQALHRASAHLGLPKRTSHALRSFYVTMRRGHGASEAQIADEIGVTSVALVGQVYGSRPPNWDGLRRLKYWPDNAAPAWHRWKPQANGELDFTSSVEKIVAIKP